MDPEHLKANFSKVTEEEVRYDFSASELTDMKAQLVEASIEKSTKEKLATKFKSLLTADSDDLQNELHLIIDKAKAYLGPRGIKTLTGRAGELLEKVKNGYEMRWVNVYEMDFSEEGRLEYYDQNGIFLWEKRVAGPRQLHLKTNNAVGQ